MNYSEEAEEDGLYDPRFEHDNCGIGAVVNIKGKRVMRQLKMHLKLLKT